MDVSGDLHLARHTSWQQTWAHDLLSPLYPDLDGHLLPCICQRPSDIPQLSSSGSSRWLIGRCLRICTAFDTIIFSSLNSISARCRTRVCRLLCLDLCLAGYGGGLALPLWSSRRACALSPTCNSKLVVISNRRLSSNRHPSQDRVAWLSRSTSVDFRIAHEWDALTKHLIASAESGTPQ